VDQPPDRDDPAAVLCACRLGKTGKNAVPIHLCEHHLYANARKALGNDGIAEYGHATLEAMRDVFKSLEGWEAFAEVVNTDPSAKRGQRWVKHWHKRMQVQTARRASLLHRCA
jgi:hypothetical protein